MPYRWSILSTLPSRWQNPPIQVLEKNRADRFKVVREERRVTLYECYRCQGSPTGACGRKHDPVWDYRVVSTSTASTEEMAILDEQALLDSLNPDL